MIDVLVVGVVGNALKFRGLRLQNPVFTLLVVGYATAHVLTRGNQAKVLVGLQSAILVKYYFCCSKATRGIGVARSHSTLGSWGGREILFLEVHLLYFNCL